MARKALDYPPVRARRYNVRLAVSKREEQISRIIQIPRQFLTIFMFLSLVIGRFKDYFDANIAKIIKTSKTNCIYFNLINLSEILLITNYNNDIMRRLLSIPRCCSRVKMFKLFTFNLRPVKRWCKSPLSYDCRSYRPHHKQWCRAAFFPLHELKNPSRPRLSMRDITGLCWAVNSNCRSAHS